MYGKFETGYLYLWTLPDRKTWCFPISDLRTMVTAAVALQDERDVYFGLGAADEDIPKNKRPKAKEVTCLPGFGMDVDLKARGAHVQKKPSDDN